MRLPVEDDEPADCAATAVLIATGLCTDVKSVVRATVSVAIGQLINCDVKMGSVVIVE